jgi:hypothetical protein
MQRSWLRLLAVPGRMAGGDKNSRCPREIGINIQPKRNARMQTDYEANTRRGKIREKRERERERKTEKARVLYRFVSHRQMLFSERIQRAFCSLWLLYDFYYQHLRSFYRRFLIHRDGDAPRHEDRPIFHRLPMTVEVKTSSAGQYSIDCD